jgi:GNAT superfamily N-acetyltransferase
MSGEDDSNVLIVPITEEHIAEYHRAVDLVAREGKYLGRTEALPLEDAQSFTRENIARGNAHFVAVHGGRVVGWCDIVPSKKEAFVHCGTLGMGLLAEYRGRGIGHRLRGECFNVVCMALFLQPARDRSGPREAGGGAG